MATHVSILVWEIPWTEETLQILQSPDEIVPDSLDSLPGNEEALMEESEEFEKASKLTGPVSIFIDLILSLKCIS